MTGPRFPTPRTWKPVEFKSKSVRIVIVVVGRSPISKEIFYRRVAFRLRTNNIIDGYIAHSHAPPSQIINAYKYMHCKSTVQSFIVTMNSVENDKDFTRAAYTVYYNTESHWSVLTQLHGSIWHKVLPYCFVNMFIMIGLIVAGKPKVFDISKEAHTFVTLVVSFLLVSRVNIGLSRYNQARDALGAMYRESRELISSACVFSHKNKDTAAKEWRQQVAYRCLILLRTAMAVIDYPETKFPAWDIPELQGVELEAARSGVFIRSDVPRWGDKKLSEWEETMRVPIRMAYLLRKTVHAQEDALKTPMPLPLEVRLHGSIDGFMGGYYGIRKFLTTPVPFPLIQMARAFMFIYVFTVPFVLLSDESGDIPHCIAAFLVTYGFVGLETVAIELDNPFGFDENDFDNNALALTAYEDTYMTIKDADGAKWADRLRDKMHNGTKLPDNC